MRVVRTVAVLLLVVLGATPASAATGTYLRLAHLTPDTARVDITITPNAGAPIRVPNVGYGSVLDYRRIEPGAYTVAMRPVGADLNSEPITSVALQAADGKAYTVADLSKAAKVLEDDISLPPAGLSRLRVINAAPAAPELDLVRNGALVHRQVGYGSATAYAVIAPGTVTMQVLPRGGEPVTLQAGIEPGGVYTVVVTETEGKPAAALRADAKGAEVVPGGSQETGFGGMAPGGPGADWKLVGLTCLLVGSGLFLLRRKLFRFG